MRRETAARLQWTDADIFKTCRETEGGCSPRQTAASDALLIMSGAPVQRVSQMSVYNLPTLEEEEEQPKIYFYPPKPISCFLRA